MSIYKQFLNAPSCESGFSVEKARSGYRVERWSILKGDRTGQVWRVAETAARRINPEADAAWRVDRRAHRLLELCESKGVGVVVVQEGYEVR